MRMYFISCSLWVTISCAACGYGGNIDSASFDDVVDPVEETPRQIEPSYRVVSPDVRNYLEHRRRQMKIVATTKTRRGQIYDWIDIHSQTPDGEIATPPGSPDLPETFEGNRQPRPVHGELEDEPEVWGPPGTVPVLRIDPGRIHAPGSVADFLSKYGDAAVRPFYGRDEGYVSAPQIGPADRHLYATVFKTMTNFGGDGFINVWQPFVLFTTEMSLAQIAVSSGNPPIETIESGWHVNGALYGDFATRLFVFFTTNGYSREGANIGGYNMNQPGWIQVSSTVTPGTILTPVSTQGGAQYDFYIRIQLFNGSWWVQFQNTWLGYFPASLFAQNRLRTSATRIDFFGETVDSADVPGMTISDMGSGLFPSINTWWTNAAYMRNLEVQTSQQQLPVKFALPYATHITNAKCYSLVSNFEASDSFQSQFYFGGPGQNLNCP